MQFTRGLPLVGVMPIRETDGINNLDDRAPMLEILPFQEAFAKQYPTDAHFVTYTAVNTGQAGWPRCNKPILSKLRVAAPGADLLATMLVFDYDNVDHANWTSKSFDEFQSALFLAADNGFPLCLTFTLFYQTLHGARFVYALQTPVPVDKAEDLHRGLVLEFAHAGIVLDSKCSDWTHIFRMPWVVREGKPTWDRKLEYVEQSGNRILPADIVPSRRASSTYSVIEELDLPQPLQQEAEDLLLVTSDSGRLIHSEWYKIAKKRLKGRNCYSCIFEHSPIAMPSQRDSTIQSYVGEAVGMLCQTAGASPQLIYALFLSAVLQLNPDEGTPDWTVVLWKAVLKYWAKEVSKVVEVKKQEALLAQGAESLVQQLLHGVRKWCKDPEIHSEDPAAIEWLAQHLIACAPRSYYVMLPDGTYDQVGVTGSHLIARIRELGMDAVIPIRLQKKDGGTRDALAADLINPYGTIVNTIEGAVGIDGSYIRNIGQPSATLVQRLFQRRADLEPKYSNDVDVWLQQLAGVHYDKLCLWIAKALAFEEGPICALSISGPPGLGKKLLAIGLAECIDTEVIADTKELGDKQTLLAKTPFLLVNEGFPKFATGLSAADSFRRLVAGDPIFFEQKFRDTIIIRNPLRMMLMANNQGVVSTLTDNKDLSPEDRDALAERLFHIDVGDAACTWLKEKGGLSFTGKKGSRWIRNDSGGESDNIVASHFMYLYANRPPTPPGRRFLVEGDRNSSLIRAMATRSGSAPYIIETLLRMIENPLPVEGLWIEQSNGGIFATINGIISFHRKDIGVEYMRALAEPAVRSVMRALRPRDETMIPASLMGLNRKLNWHPMDARLLYEEAMEKGIRCNKLATLIEKSDCTTQATDPRVEEVVRRFEQETTT